ILEICDLTKLPSCWIPPRRDDGKNFVYRLNLENDPGAWLDNNQQPLSMAAMIKSEDQNAWGGGSSGSTPPDKATKVTALDGVFCRVAKHVCQGIFVCSELDPSLLDGHERYEPDDDAMRELCEAERVVNVRENSSLAGFHNHPTNPARKLTRKGKKKYEKAIEAAGVTGLAALKCDFATTTAKIFEGKILGEVEPALLNNRVKRQLIQKAKKAVNPDGMGIEGSLVCSSHCRVYLMCSKQYIWKVASEHGEEIIITMLPNIAKRIHFARASLHDNTYAPVHGIRKEWEVVIYDIKFYFRM
ncbi:hypothetical protein C8R43DRAFT_827151, partial [Mycena crocata]